MSRTLSNHWSLNQKRELIIHPALHTTPFENYFLIHLYSVLNILILALLIRWRSSYILVVWDLHELMHLAYTAWEMAVRTWVDQPGRRNLGGDIVKTCPKSVFHVYQFASADITKYQVVWTAIYCFMLFWEAGNPVSRCLQGWLLLMPVRENLVLYFFSSF